MAPFPPEENRLLCVMLLCCGYRSDALTDLIQQHYAAEAAALTEIAFSCFQSHVGLDFRQDKELTRCFQQELNLIIVRYHLGFCRKKDRVIQDGLRKYMIRR